MNVLLTKTAYVQGETPIPARLIKELRRADIFISLAVQAGYKALGESAYIPRSEIHGLVLGTAFGPMQTNFDVLDQVVYDQQTSPTLFSHSVFNAAAGYLSRIFALQGSALTITDFAFPFFLALNQGILAISSGEMDSCLVLQVETYSDLYIATRARIIGKDVSPWPIGAVAWLLSKDNGERAPMINTIEVNLHPASPSDYIIYNHKITSTTHFLTVSDPLGSAMAITKNIEDGLQGEESFYIDAPYGNVKLSFMAPPAHPRMSKAY
jgi:hypothetical protein